MIPNVLQRFAKVDLNFGIDPVPFFQQEKSRPKGISGIKHDELVQVVAYGAYLRDACQWGGTAQLAWFDDSGKFVMFTDTVTGAGQKKFAERRKLHPIPIFGANAYGSNFEGGGDLGKNWGRSLAQAMDATLSDFARLERSTELPTTITGERLPVIAPAILAIIVAGAAVATIGTTAVFWHFTSDILDHAITVYGASRAYEARVMTFQKTGVMPDPTPVEIGAKKAIEARAGKGREEGWTAAALIGGGTAAASLVAAAVWGATRKKSRKNPRRRRRAA